MSEFVDDEHRIVGKRELPFTSNDIKRFSKKRNPFNHPAVMFKKTAVIKAGGYDETYHLFEDYYLWIRMLMLGYQGYNIPDSILDMRVTSDLYLRRGGKDYARYMLAFHKWMKDAGWSSTADYCFGALPHALVCLLPNGIRKQLYKWLHS